MGVNAGHAKSAMNLPGYVADALATLLHGVSRTDLAQRAARLSRSYRSGAAAPDAVTSFQDALAYAVTRMPATYAAVAAALAYTAEQLPEWRPESVLDLGAGPGTASIAALDRWPGIRHVTMVERSAASRSLARKLSEAAPTPALSGVHIVDGDLTSAASLTGADLAIAAYVLAELRDADVVPTVLAALSRTRHLLVLVEPGTPAGFERIRLARAALIGGGASAIAPCPHSLACPIVAPDWCHFSVRLSRSRDHRLTKQAERSFEDEKYSYLAVSRTLVPRNPAPRIVAPPRAGKADVVLRVCDVAGLAERRISRRHKLDYKAAKKLGWGDIVRDTCE